MKNPVRLTVAIVLIMLGYFGFSLLRGVRNGAWLTEAGGRFFEISSTIEFYKHVVGIYPDKISDVNAVPELVEKYDRLFGRSEKFKYEYSKVSTNSYIIIARRPKSFLVNELVISAKYINGDLIKREGF